jgi:hypothetical protein
MSIWIWHFVVEILHPIWHGLGLVSLKTSL